MNCIRLVGLIRPDLIDGLARLDGGLFVLGDALLGSGYNGGIVKLTAHRQISDLCKVLVEPSKQIIHGAGLREVLAK